MHYVVKRTPDTPNAEGVVVGADIIAYFIDHAAGRTIAGYVLGQLGWPRRKTRVYVATAAGSPGRAAFGRGFIVEKVDA